MLRTYMGIFFKNVGVLKRGAKKVGVDSSGYDVLFWFKNIDRNRVS